MQSLDRMIQLEEKRAKAWLSRDREAIGNQLHDDSLEINIYGRFTRQQILDDLFPKVEMLKFQMSDHRLIDTGPGSCGLSYRVEEQISSEGQVLSFPCYVTAIYKQEGKQWMLLLWHITPLKEGPNPR